MGLSGFSFPPNWNLCSFIPWEQIWRVRSAIWSTVAKEASGHPDHTTCWISDWWVTR